MSRGRRDFTSVTQQWRPSTRSCAAQGHRPGEATAGGMPGARAAIWGHRVAPAVLPQQYPPAVPTAAVRAVLPVADTARMHCLPVPAAAPSDPPGSARSPNRTSQPSRPRRDDRTPGRTAVRGWSSTISGSRLRRPACLRAVLGVGGQVHWPDRNSDQDDRPVPSSAA